MKKKRLLEEKAAVLIETILTPENSSHLSLLLSLVPYLKKYPEETLHIMQASQLFNDNDESLFYHHFEGTIERGQKTRFHFDENKTEFGMYVYELIEAE